MMREITKIFINLPVKDLNKSKSFFSKIGFTFNEEFTDETAACMVIADNIFAMLLTHSKFQEFTPKQISDSHKTTEVLTCISAESKAKVNQMVDIAMKEGGSETRQSQDYGFMFGRSFNDPDGHIWEVMWMDESAFEETK